ncbi:YraN family protein [Candidatus Gracilibacteria bacterium]|nr:YraN family protein [Candidatus Gracilibacteria bacterium]NUJ98880.1 YraN family protein [Candidatus Gracilibacteria bacterium]
MKKLGDQAEIKAIEYLKQQGYTIIDTNFKYGRFGEIDIIGKKEKKVYFFEVKYRKNDFFGIPEESITKAKKRKLFYSLEFYCLKNMIDRENIEVHIITFLGDLSKKDCIVHHYKNVDIGF